MRCMDREFVRFVWVGLVNTAAGYLLYLLLLRFLPYTVSFTLVYAAGIFISYGLNSRFVYRQPLALKKALRFPAVYAVQYVLSALMLWAAVELFAVDPHVASLLAVALTVPVVSCWAAGSYGADRCRIRAPTLLRRDMCGGERFDVRGAGF